MMLRVLVVDDEPLAREVVVDLLRRDTDISGVTEVGDPRCVPAMIAAEHPDILFLDIEMPGLSGLQIASMAGNRPPVIVFVTAFSQYAIEAFDVEATDYLLKPFSDERFFQALDRAKRRVHELRAGTPIAVEKHATDSEVAREPFLTRLAVGPGAHATCIGVADVLWIEAEDYYVQVHTRRERYLLRMSMSSLERRLDPRAFVRVHRAAIVNVREVMRIEADAGSLVLSDGTHIPISRSRRSQVEKMIRARASQ
jgi:two-component system, LytTR family, response regulator